MAIILFNCILFSNLFEATFWGMKNVMVEVYLVLTFAFGLRFSDFIGGDFYAECWFLGKRGLGAYKKEIERQSWC